jgi:hypothetical protein
MANPLPPRFRTLIFVLILLLWLVPASLQAQEGIQAEEEEAPEAPLLLLPADGERTTGESHPPLGMPTFVWSPVAEATKYQIQISVSSGFAATVLDEESENSSYTPVNLLGNGLFYWRVRAATGTGSRAVWGPYSDGYSVEIDWGNGDALRPVLLSPEDGAVKAAFDHNNFSWMAVAGAATYRLQISTNENFADVVYTATTLATHLTPASRLQNNLYYWRVIPIDNKGNLGAPSVVRQFTFNWSNAPHLLAPEDDATIAFVPRFSWTAVEAAREYRLQISTQDNFITYDQIVTRNTDYTPVKKFSNDQDYFWRVQAVDGLGIASPWSEIRRYRAQWNFKPQLLTPDNPTIRLAYPFFSWAPVAGAERYQIQIADNNSFLNPKIVDTTLYNVTNYTQPEWKTAEIDKFYYWQVRAIDARGNYTPWSDTWSFQFATTTVPSLVYPLPYYTPDNQNLPVHGDRSFGSPLFIWDTAHSVSFFPSFLPVPADYYRLEVDDDPGFGSPNFAIESAGIAAAPTMTDPFADLEDGKFYYWRVRAYHGGQPMSVLQSWVTRYSSAASQLPVASSADPIYPRDGFEAVEMPPVLGWLPVEGAAHYRVQVAKDTEFTKIVDEAEAQFVNYVPWQGRLNSMPFGAYWWRVRAEDEAKLPIGDWSAPRRFNLSLDLAIGNHYDFLSPENLAEDKSGRAHVASSTNNGMGSYELRDLYVIVDRRADDSYNQHWVIAFTTGATLTDTVSYALYFDTNHVANSGAASAPRATTINTDPLYRPEYLLYVDKVGGGISAQFYRWNGNVWNAAQDLVGMGGRVTFDETLQSIQILLPYTALGSANTDWVGSLAMAVYSLEGTTVRDMIPEQGAILDNPVFLSNMLLPLYPFDTPLSNPIVHFDVPPIRWRMPAFGADGYQVQMARDVQFTDVFETWESYETQSSPFFTLIPSTFQTKIVYADNESYYWRVRTRHEKYSPKSTSYDYGPWSPAMRFKLDSRLVGNPRLSTGVDAFMTPTFLWDRVEGAAGYTIQIDDDSNFSSPLLTQATDADSFTPSDTSTATSLQPGTQYFWRVVMRRSNQILGHWSQPLTFIKTSIAPESISPAHETVLNRQPTFLWTAVITPSVTPRLATPHYRIQVDSDPSFSQPVINQSTQATSFTPAKGQSLKDGTWYWRVALVDANGRIGPYSPTRRFVKEYPLPEPLSPPQNTTADATPVFEWAPIHGAAYYRIEYADNPNFSRSTSVNTDLTRYRPTKALANTNYAWRVQMFDADRNPGPVIEGRFSLGHLLYLPTVIR